MAVSEQELAALAGAHDIISLGMLADEIRRRRHGTTTTFVRVAEVPSDPGAPIVVPPTAGEVRIAGVPATRAAAVQRVGEVAARLGASADDLAIDAAAADHVTGAALSAWSLADLEDLAARDGATLRALLEELRAAGLELVAAAPYDLLRDARRSIEEVNIAGLALARLTIEKSPAADPLHTLRAIADLQRAVAVVRAFAPLPRRINPAVPTTGYGDVRQVALARIVIDNVGSIQVDWSLYGPKLAQVALTVGADDVDAVSPLDDINQGRRRAPLEEIRRNIRAAGQEPAERNGRFELRGR
jgi:aminodeoxyfutalosine synthase